MIPIECSNCKKPFSFPIELWWAEPNAPPRAAQCPDCKAWNIITLTLRIEAKVHGVVSK